jgi:hypothetical protein
MNGLNNCFDLRTSFRAEPIKSPTSGVDMVSSMIGSASRKYGNAVMNQAASTVVLILVSVGFWWHIDLHWCSPELQGAMGNNACKSHVAVAGNAVLHSTLVTDHALLCWNRLPTGAMVFGCSRQSAMRHPCDTHRHRRTLNGLFSTDSE